MASDEPYQPFTFRTDRTQHAQHRVNGLVFLVVGVCMVAFSAKAGTDRATASIIIAGLFIAAIGVLGLTYRRQYTTIDAEGIYTSFGPWGRRTCRWADVIDVELSIDANDAPPVRYRIKVHRRVGGPFTLPAPTDEVTGDRHDNPEFNGQLAMINSYWLNGAGPQQQSQARA
jgi:hypothetical protein